MMKVENRVGRLIEMTFVAPYPALELSQFFYALSNIISRSRVSMTTVVDLRAYGAFTPAEEKALTGLMRADNKLVVQTGFLLDGSADGRAQIELMIGNAGSPNRRVFTSSASLTAWMEPILAPAESIRLKTFLAALGRTPN